jgi:SAM-dependent methyltransferase
MMDASSTVPDADAGTAGQPRVALHPISTESLAEVKRVAKERLFPSITNSSWLVLRARRRLFEQWLARLGDQELSVLDVGGRIQPYRLLLNGREERYLAVDMRPSPLVNLLASAEDLPLEYGQFDLVICTQVLQYVKDPARAIAEIFRLLKPGGHLLLSVPAAYPRDSEHECWRFLPEALKFLLTPFSRIEIQSEGGTITGMCRTVAVWLTTFVRPAFLRTFLRYSAVPLLNLTAIALEPLFGKGNDQFAVNYSVFAQK